MEPLSPSQAADVASKVYSVEDLEKAKLQARFGINGLFSVDGAGRFEGVSGSAFFGSKTGFGYIAAGIGTRKNEALIAIRGTSNLADCLTDINMAAETGSSGYLVHAGFHRTFESFKSLLSAKLNVMKPSGVHVVGHSLGGALATMVADYIHERGVQAKLYTFGAPRSGMTPHCQHLTKTLPAENIFRVYHGADPVTMIPIFPFQHAPVSGSAYFLPSTGSIDYHSHSISHYIACVKDSGWRGLRGLSPAKGWKKQAEDYLQSLDSEGGVVMLSAAYLRMILNALEAIIDGVGVCVGYKIVSDATIMDRLAQLLYNGYLTSARIAEQVKRVVIAILKFLGRPAAQGTNVSVVFLSWLLNTLFVVISNVAVRALNLHLGH